MVLFSATDCTQLEKERTLHVHTIKNIPALDFARKVSGMTRLEIEEMRGDSRLKK